MERDDKKMPKQVVSDDLLLDRLVQVVIHDLQIGLQGLLTDVEMLNRNLSTPETKLDRLRKDVRDILSRVELLIATTDNLRATRLDYESSLFDLDNTIRLAIQTIAAVAAERDLNIQYKNQMTGPTTIKGSHRLVSVTLYNLLMNAIKYSYHRPDASSPIFVNLKEHGRDVEIEIQNRGIPIGEDEKNVIFEKFYRGRMAAQKRAPGSGLGLYLAKTIAEKHHGGLTIASRPLEGDAAVVTVTVRLPREISEE